MGSPSYQATVPFWSQERLNALTYLVRKVDVLLDLFPFDLDLSGLGTERADCRFLSASVSFSATPFSSQISVEKARCYENQRLHTETTSQEGYRRLDSETT